MTPGSARANALAEAHRAGIGQFYDCDHAMQVNVAESYVADHRFRAHYVKLSPGLAPWLRDVVVANAEQQDE